MLCLGWGIHPRSWWAARMSKMCSFTFPKANRELTSLVSGVWLLVGKRKESGYRSQRGWVCLWSCPSAQWTGERGLLRDFLKCQKMYRKRLQHITKYLIKVRSSVCTPLHSVCWDKITGCHWICCLNNDNKCDNIHPCIPRMSISNVLTKTKLFDLWKRNFFFFKWPSQWPGLNTNQ